jgi:hypothetical protein
LLIRFATGLVGADAASDVLSTAVLQALRARTWPSVTNHRAYLYRCVLNEATAHQRAVGRRRRQGPLQFAYEGDISSSGAPQPTDPNRAAVCNVDDRSGQRFLYGSVHMPAVTLTVTGARYPVRNVTTVGAGSADPWTYFALPVGTDHEDLRLQAKDVHGRALSTFVLGSGAICVEF